MNLLYSFNQITLLHLRVFFVVFTLSVANACFAQSSISVPMDRTAELACSSLQGILVPSAAIGLATQGASIQSAEFISANSPDNHNGEFCKVIGAIHPFTNNAPDIIFEVNLPSNWNGKSLQMGGGGLNGTLVTGLGPHIKQADTEANPLARAYVTLGSDSGHQSDGGFDGSFFLNDEALRNFGHEQIKKTHDVAMFLVNARYGVSPSYNYFIGGSQGGHEAFDAVQRYPDDYDGVVAGYPAHNLVMLHLSANHFAKALFANAERSWISPAKVTAFTTAVYATCDALDDAEDGIISNIAACIQATADFKRFGPENPIRCVGGADTGNNCLSDVQIEALNLIDTPFDLGFSVYPDDEGNSIYPKWTPYEGSTFVDGGFPNLGAQGPGQALQFGPGNATPKYAIAQDLTLDTINDFDPRRYAGRIGELAHLISANSVNLDRYQAKGGKLLFFHGRADDFIPVYSSIQYYERLQARYEPEVLADFVKFYTIPGMGHISGVFNARISLLSILDNWVAAGQEPGELVAVDANPETAGRTRPVCEYPQWPRYQGRGDINDAASFTCVNP
tara:strand:- start:206135 stop:207823 length:1689 start_codon:yes stop_codon:yes gene_type:complete